MSFTDMKFSGTTTSFAGAENVSEQRKMTASTVSGLIPTGSMSITAIPVKRKMNNEIEYGD